MSTPSGDGNQWTQPGAPDRPAPPTAPAPSGYGTPSSPSYGKYGQGQAAPTPAPAPPAPGPEWGQPPAHQTQWGQQPQWGRPSQYDRPNWQQLAGGFRAAGALGPAVLAFSVLYTVVTWLTVIVQPSSPPASTVDEITVDAALVLGLISIPILLGVWIVTSVWLTRARGNAVLLNPQGQRRTEGWAWFGWVLPIVYLWFPKQILDDTARDTLPASGDRPLSTRLYWSLWVSSIVIGALGTMLGLLEVDSGTVQLVRYAEAVVLTLALGPWVQLVRRLSTAQDKLAADGPVRPD